MDAAPNAAANIRERHNSLRVAAVTSEVSAVMLGSEIIGFVEETGPIFVALAGHRYDRAEEVAQKLRFDDARDELLAHAPLPAPAQIAAASAEITREPRPIRRSVPAPHAA